MKKVLIVSGHPDLENNSITNKAAINEYERLIPNLEVVKLDELYPDFKIDVESEQKKLENADVVVLQFPVFWYYTPALMQKWLEEVLLPGFAYGDDGDKLKGKDFLISMTIGTPASEYGTSVPILISDLPKTLASTAIYCGMNYAGEEHVDNVSNIPGLDEAEKERLTTEGKKLAQRIVERINSLS